MISTIKQQIQRLKDLIEIIPSDEKAKLIKEFQDVAWGNDKSIDLKVYAEEMNANQELEEIFLELAYDFDFYEPDDELAKETTSFYGTEKLNSTILEALQRIDRLSLH